MNHQVLVSSLLVLICIETSIAKTIKPNTRPVHEVINEKTRSDQEAFRSPPLYGNPLASNSKNSARQHALNQQAMFIAEKNRQHRAQTLRWTAAPQQMDSYMKAYHESQENHHLALERQQAQLKGIANEAKNADQFTPITPTAATLKQKQAPKRTSKTTSPGNKQLKTRNHRSYGSVDYYSSPNKYQTIYMSAAPGYEGVTIKPNGNVGVEEAYTQNSDEAQSQLYTQSIPSNTQYVYPKQYSQMQGYHSAQDIDTLHSLLKKTPNDQLSELHALIHSSKQHNEEQDSQDATPVHQPIDLYFYMKDTPSPQSLSEHYDQAKYVHVPQTYAEAYSPQHAETGVKDHTPITEDVDDIADPNKPNRLTSYGIQPVLTPQEHHETTTTKSNNYYKVEVASQTISSGYKPTYHSQVKQPVQYVLQHESEEEHKPEYQALQYGEHQQPSYYLKHPEKEEGDSSERYLHHNAQHVGVQHLSEDGTGMSAYGEENENLHYAAKYEFGYRVRDHHSGNDFGHHEAKNGEKTNGHYHVLLPDGRMQKVKYWAGPSGFHADISYDHLQQPNHE